MFMFVLQCLFIYMVAEIIVKFPLLKAFGGSSPSSAGCQPLRRALSGLAGAGLTGPEKGNCKRGSNHEITEKSRSGRL